MMVLDDEGGEARMVWERMWCVTVSGDGGGEDVKGHGRTVY